MCFVNYSWCVDWWRYVSTTSTWPPSAGCLWKCYTCTDVWLRSAISITAPWSSTISLDTVSCRRSLFSVFSTKVGMIGFFCKREMVQWFNELQDVGGIIMLFCCVYGTELWPNLVFYLLQWSQESSWVCLWVYTQTAMETAHCKCYTPPPPWIYRARK